jgi:hypothetical protein
MPEEKTDAVEKLLSEEKAIEDRKQALIADLLKQKETAMKDFDEKLAKLGYQANSSGRTRRSHHRKETPAADAAAKPKAKA